VKEEDAGNAQELIQEYWKTIKREKRAKEKPARKRAVARDSAASGSTSTAKAQNASKGRDGSNSLTARSVSLDEDMIERPAKKRGRPLQASDGLVNPRPAKKPRRNDSSFALQPREMRTEFDEVEIIHDMGPWLHLRSWEGLVKQVDLIEQGDAGQLVAYITLDNDRRHCAPAPEVAKRCPQMLIGYYESHIIFKDMSSDNGSSR